MADEPGDPPSRFGLVAQCRERVEQGKRAFWSEVTRQVAHLNRARRASGRAARTVTQADIESAILTGYPPAESISRNSDGSWNLTINGVDTEGEDIAVTVELSEDWLLIKSFLLHHWRK